MKPTGEDKCLIKLLRQENLAGSLATEESGSHPSGLLRVE